MEGFNLYTPGELVYTYKFDKSIHHYRVSGSFVFILFYFFRNYCKFCDILDSAASAVGLHCSSHVL